VREHVQVEFYGVHCWYGVRLRDVCQRERELKRNENKHFVYVVNVLKCTVEVLVCVHIYA